MGALSCDYGNTIASIVTIYLYIKSVVSYFLNTSVIDQSD